MCGAVPTLSHTLSLRAQGERLSNEQLLEQLSAVGYATFELFKVNKCTKTLRLKVGLNRRFGNVIRVTGVDIEVSKIGF
jgi:D-ribose pyranose/furanose isomerase RbsD